MNQSLYKEFMESIIQYRFKNLALLNQAMTHVSSGVVNNERLEFLGDRILGLVIAELLLEKFPHENEGDIGKRYASLVQSETLALIGNRLNLKKYLHAVGTEINDSIIGDATEALIAAIYLDGGYTVSAEFIKKYWNPLIKLSDMPPQDSKTKLQEMSQAKGLGLPIYRNISREGPDHNPIFQVEVSVKKFGKFVGRGTSKKNAEQEAATQLLQKVKSKSDA
ncbi:MAG: ribonuclease III [Alphaproteobacteria bacterium]|nr:ribonuclease III [Alphaproteobacteria bacterium]|tara:strand:+ start:4635 stop:5300 length:666 start_codon:yes stop_codon:yes gene_type:complete